MAFRWKQGLIVAMIFAVGGIFIRLPDLGNFGLRIFPGILLAALLHALGLIQRGNESQILCGWAIICNPIVYGIVGFLIGAFIKFWKYMIITTLIVALLAFVLLVLIGVIGGVVR
jgi:hypothetical protein